MPLIPSKRVSPLPNVGESGAAEKLGVDLQAVQFALSLLTVGSQSSNKGKGS
jgi:hypothetical protein